MQSTKKRWTLRSLRDTINLGEKIPRLFPDKQLLMIQGPLGVGKTSLVQGIAKALAINEPITSPTFTLAQHYFYGKKPLIHIDLYRLDNPIVANELFLQEEEEGIKNNALIVVEWSERLSIDIEDALLIEMKYLQEGGRMAQILDSSFLS